MGLTPDAVPADMKDAIMSKLGISGGSSKQRKSSEDGQNKNERVEKKDRKKDTKKVQASAKADREKQTRMAGLKETDLLVNSNVGGNEKLSLSDLFHSLDADK